MKHFPQHLKSGIEKLVHHLFAGLSVSSAEGGIDCTVFDDAHREIWHQNGFSDEEVHALCIAVGCCENENS